MKKRILCLLLAGAMALLCSGCGSLLERDYYYTEDYTDTVFPTSGDAMEIRNYSMLKSALVNLISNCEEEGELRFTNYNGSVMDDLATACLEVKTENPLGAYAVESLTHDTSRIVSYYTATIYIRYKKSAEQIAGVIGVPGAAELESTIRTHMLALEREIVARVYSAQVNEETVAEMIREVYYADPVSLVLEPTAEVTAYPQSGVNHIYEIKLQYGLVSAALQHMSAALREAADTLVGEIDATAPAQRAYALAQALHANLNRSEGAYCSTAYGALVEHCADDKGTALAYQALCNAAGIECRVVCGSIGRLGAQEHYWNIIRIGEEAYHVDVSRFAAGGARDFLLSDEMLWGTYIWDTEKYPACSGTLRYPVPELPEESEETAPPVPEESEEPEATEEENLEITP